MAIYAGQVREIDEIMGHTEPMESEDTIRKAMAKHNKEIGLPPLP